MLEQMTVFKDIVSRLDREGIPYMVTGSLAMNHYGQPRMTRDIDLVVELGPEEAPRIEAALGGDYYFEAEAVRRALLHRGMFNVIHFREVVKVDFIVRKTDPYRQTEFERRQTVLLEGQSLSIVSPEDLLLSKLSWARESRSELQFRDVRNLISSVSGLDWEYVRKWARELKVENLLDEVTQ